ncbi:branched-chain amino acid ABC transporter permease [Pseudonocardia asaccharolytica]|uniref:Branched-chain amino acid ABC transporter permease n=1 Tax=Pseudonocardia asaccharolytica DSM 44247 = NBRC 16224 TaxID=1123024 RepID=A0A511CWE6_9PSEU|nr:branched-chain amino acid ABC transporter permease [Pseudonocardia asaccharolytica]GEL16881.1 branched-chain amino acid ABC transporter permease [Pseudonocardia asaccharolytica DSM 44247 = NBRC 16224]
MSAFLTYLITGLALGCSFALVASGFVAIHRVTGVVNFAQGTFAVVAGLMAGSLLGRGLPHGLAEILAILLAGAVGLVVGVIAIGKRGTPPLASLVITLGLGILAYAVEIIIWGDQPISFQMVPGSVDIAGAPILRQYLVVIAVALVTFAGLGLFFGRSYLGKALTACASNPYAARLAGINVMRMGLLAFALGGLLGGLAGVLVTPLQPVAFDSDVALATNGFAAAIFGGLNRPGLALVGGLVLGVAEAFVAGYLSGSYQTEVALALMLAIMIWRASRRVSVAEEPA